MPVLIQRAFALLTVVVMAPVLGLLAVAVRLESRGPALHRARRVGATGEFTLYKLRTMAVGAEAVGPGITVAADPRVTRLGRILRRTKLDELPQLWNVVRGDMLVVGPRPEDPRYVDRADPLHALVFGARPGITGPAALAYRDEEQLLAAEGAEIAQADGRSEPTAADVERAYCERILPRKLELDAEYLRTRSARGDLAILGRTIGQVLRGTGDR